MIGLKTFKIVCPKATSTVWGNFFALLDSLPQGLSGGILNSRAETNLVLKIASICNLIETSNLVC